MDKYTIPQHLDSPFKVILWTWDEAVAFSVPFFTLFLLMNSPLIGVGVGIFLVFLLKKMKGEEGHYFLAHMAYWHLPPLIRYKVTPPSYIREIIG